MPLKAYDTMIVNRFNRFDGIVSGVKGCRAEIRCQVFDALAMDRINLTSLTKQTLHNAVFLRANGVRSTKWQALPVIFDMLIKSAAKSNIYQLQTAANSHNWLVLAQGFFQECQLKLIANNIVVVTIDGLLFPTGLRFVLYPEGLRLQDCSSLKLHPTGELKGVTGMRLAALRIKEGQDNPRDRGLYAYDHR